MIKRYHVSSRTRKIPLGNGQTATGIGLGERSVESENGDWVKYEDVKEALDILDSCGLYFHLDKRIGKSKEDEFRRLLKPYMKEFKETGEKSV